MGKLSENEIIDILKNIVCDEVVGTYCIEIQKTTNCSENCKNDDCFIVKAIERNFRPLSTGKRKE